MRKYFFTRDKQKYGPFKLEELKQYQITADTKIWFEGLSEWKSASEIPELSGIIIAEMPPKPQHKPHTEANSAPKEKKAILDLSKATSWLTITFPGYFKDLKRPDFRNKYTIIGSAGAFVILLTLVLIFTLGGSTDDANNNAAGFTEEEVEVNDPVDPPKTDSQQIVNTEAQKVRSAYKDYFPVNINYSIMGRRGGVKNVVVTVQNKTSYQVKHITIAVEYLNPRNKVVDTEYIQFPNVAPNTSLSKPAPDFKRCETARAVLNKLLIPSIGLKVYPKVEK